MFGVETLLRLLAPYDCLSCGEEGPLLCERCLSAVVYQARLLCFRCSTATKHGNICDHCRGLTGIEAVYVAAVYEGMLRKLIRRYKFDRAKDASGLLARVLTARLPVVPPEMLITYVPTATSRIRERGYDHAEQLAKAYARTQGRKISKLLRRYGQARQVGASRRQRLSQLDSAFWVRNTHSIRGRDILLIDDVTTTGASLLAAAAALRTAGARTVWALVVAQKQ